MFVVAVGCFSMVLAKPCTAPSLDLLFAQHFCFFLVKKIWPKPQFHSRKNWKASARVKVGVSPDKTCNPIGLSNL